MTFNHRKTVTFGLTQSARAFRVRSGSHLTRLGLHPGQETVLKALAEEDGQTMSRLAAELDVQPPTVTKMVSRLAANDLVERRASDDDGRQAHVFLTEEGRAKIGEIDKTLRKLERDALAGLDNGERKRLRRHLRRIAHNLGASLVPEEDDSDESGHSESEET